MSETHDAVRVLPIRERPYADLTCDVCGGGTKVIDSRGSRGAIRRRRECLHCRHRFTTYEGRYQPIAASDRSLIAGEILERILTILKTAGLVDEKDPHPHP